MGRPSRSWRSRFFLAAACFTLVIAITGFAKTFFAPLVRGVFEAPAVVYVHAAALFGWMLLFVMQAALVQWRRPALHRRPDIQGTVRPVDGVGQAGL